MEDASDQQVESTDSAAEDASDTQVESTDSGVEDASDQQVESTEPELEERDCGLECKGMKACEVLDDVRSCMLT